MTDRKTDLASIADQIAETEVRIPDYVSVDNSDDQTNFQDNRGASDNGDPPSPSLDETTDEENQKLGKLQEENASGELQSSTRSSQFKKFLPAVPKVLKTSATGNNKTNTETNADTVKKSNAAARPSSGLPLPVFTNLKNKTEEKVIGLGSYGLGQSFLDRRQNEWLSSTRSLASYPPSVYPSSSAAVPPPPTNIVTSPSATQQQENAQAGAPEADSKNTGKGAAQQSSDNIARNNNREEGGAYKHPPSLHAMASLLPPPSKKKSVEELEDIAREYAIMNPFQLLYLGNVAALKVFGYYLLTLETFITCALTTGLTVYWYNYADEPNNSSWSGGGLDFVLLAFAVTSPISAAIGMAFQRRERALIAIGSFRSFSYHLFLAHCLWDWPEGGDMGRAKAQETARVDWIEHCDAVLAQLIGIGDELSRFLTLPTASRSRHRMTRAGRKEAARTMEVAYHLIESMTTQRLTRLILYSERLKKIGLPSGEVSRIRQYERFLSDMIEQLRIIKLYRTPQALRSFARIFTVLLPPFYAPTYAQVGREVHSLGVGISFGIITAIGLTALFESLQVIEDPFTAFLALDGIDAREEFEVLHYSQLIQTRKMIFPDAPAYPAGRRAALTHLNHPNPNKLHLFGIPPTQTYHKSAASGYAPSVASGITFEGGTATQHNVPAGDETAATQFKPPGDIDNVHEDEELGEALPLNEITANRESVFQDERQWLGVEDDPTASSGRGLRHRKNRTAFSIETVYGEEVPAGAGSGSHTSRRNSRSGGANSNANSAHSTPPNSLSHHRRTNTNNSVAGLMNYQSNFRLPDM